MAIDSYMSGEFSYDPAWYSELESVSHRDYATGYYFSDSHTDANTAETTGYLRDKAYLAVVVDYDETTGLALMSQRNKMASGDGAELLSPGKTGRSLVIGEIFDEAGEPIDSTPHPYMQFYMKTPFAVKPGDILRGV